MPMTDYTGNLLGDQPEAFDVLTKRIQSGQRIIKLVGYAGVGKTVLVGHIARWALDNGYEVTMAAPTHKAAGVIREKMGDLDVEVKTIHSLLGFGLPYDLDSNTGTRTLVKQRDADVRGVVIGDEGSMWGEVLQEEMLTLPNVQWLLVGDSAQLAPVGESPSKLLENPDFVMETILRQAAGSEILNLATDIRKGDLSLRFSGGGDVVEVPDKMALFEAAYEAFTRPDYQDTASYARMLVFRNDNRREINDRMRRLVVGSTDPFAPGEWLVIYKPFNAPTVWDQGRRFLSVEEIFRRARKLNALRDKALDYHRKTGSKSRWRQYFEYKESFAERHLHTSQEVLIAGAAPAVAAVDEDWFPPFKIWNLTIRADGADYRDLPVLDRSAYPVFNEAMGEQRRQALRFAELQEEATGTDRQHYDDERRNAWRRYFMLDEMFCHVDYAFCQTTHKAQGSTYNRVFVDVPDLMASSMKKRLMYVACTRASDQLTFYR